ncbi:hypothetical protein GC173_12145, partial [bacterium]|nr:hypothetical protein [bacterium]
AEERASEAAEARAAAERLRATAEREQYFSAIGLANAYIDESRVEKASDLLITRTPADYRSWEWGYLLARINRDDLLLAAEQGDRGSHVFSVAFSSDGATMATGHFKGLLRIWDTASGRLRYERKYDLKGIWDVAFSPDARHILLTSTDGQGLLVAGSDGDIKASFEITAHKELRVMRGGAFSPDGKLFATTGHDQNLRIWSVEDGSLIRTVAFDRETYDVQFSPDGTMVAVAIINVGRCALVDVATGSILRTLEGHDGSVLSVVFTPDGSGVVTGCADGHARLFDVKTGEMVCNFALEETSCRAVAVSPDGRYLAASGLDGLCRIWDIKSRESMGVLQGARQMEKLAFHPTRNLLATASFDEVRLWNIDRLISPPVPVVSDGTIPPVGRTLQLMGLPRSRTDVWLGYDDHWIQGTGSADVEVAGERIRIDSFYRQDSPDGKWRFVMDPSGESGMIVSRETNEPVHELSKDSCYMGRFSPDSRYFAWTPVIGPLIILETGTWKELARWQPGPQETQSVRAMSYSPDSKRLAVGMAFGSVAVWNLERGALDFEVRNAHGTAKPVYVVTFNHDGTRIASGGVDEVVHVWDVPSGKEVSTMKGHGLIIIAADFNEHGDRLLTVAMNERPKLWDVESGRELLTLNPFPGRREQLMGARFLPGSRKAVFATAKGNVGILESLDVTGREIDCEGADSRACIELGKRRQRYFPQAQLTDIEWR